MSDFYFAELYHGVVVTVDCEAKKSSWKVRYLRIVLQQPPPGVDFDVQKVTATSLKLFRRKIKPGITFEFRSSKGKDSSPNFLGAFGPGRWTICLRTL
jgi:hypothetical protein